MHHKILNNSPKTAKEFNCIKNENKSLNLTQFLSVAFFLLNRKIRLVWTKLKPLMTIFIIKIRNIENSR